MGLQVDGDGIRVQGPAAHAAALEMDVGVAAAFGCVACVAHVQVGPRTAARGGRRLDHPGKHVVERLQSAVRLGSPPRLFGRIQSGQVPLAPRLAQARVGAGGPPSCHAHALALLQHPLVGLAGAPQAPPAPLVVLTELVDGARHCPAAGVTQHQHQLDTQPLHGVLDRRQDKGGARVASDPDHEQSPEALVKCELGDHARVGAAHDDSERSLPVADGREALEVELAVGRLALRGQVATWGHAAGKACCQARQGHQTGRAQPKYADQESLSINAIDGTRPSEPGIPLDQHFESFRCANRPEGVLLFRDRGGLAGRIPI